MTSVSLTTDSAVSMALWQMKNADPVDVNFLHRQYDWLTRFEHCLIDSGRG